MNSKAFFKKKRFFDQNDSRPEIPTFKKNHVHKNTVKNPTGKKIRAKSLAKSGETGENTEKCGESNRK
jgi:hypothetical protein